MVIFLYGEDSYRRNQKVKELVEVYQKKYPALEVRIFDFEEEPESWVKVKDFLGQLSMFAKTKLAVVKEATAVIETGWVEVVKNQLKTPETFVLLSDQRKAGKEFNFLLRKPVEQHFFPELEGQLLFAFLKKESQKRQLTFSYDAWKFFCIYIANSLNRSLQAVNDLEKIALAGFPQPISLTDLRLVIRFEKREAVWRAATEILSSNFRGRRLGLLERILLQKEAPNYLFNSLAYQADGRQALNLADYDIFVKSGGLEYEEALTDFVISNW